MNDLDKVLEKILADSNRKFEAYNRWWHQELKVVTAKCVAILIIGAAVASIIVRWLP